MLLFELFIGFFVAIIYMFISQLGQDKRPKLTDFILIVITVATIIYGLELAYMIYEEYNTTNNFGVLEERDIGYLIMGILAIVWTSISSLKTFLKPKK